MIDSDALDTYTYDLSHDDPHFYVLLECAEFCWHEGMFYGLEPIVATFFEIYRDAQPEEDKPLKPLRRAYNELKTAQQIADFEDDTTAVVSSCLR